MTDSGKLFAEYQFNRKLVAPPAELLRALRGVVRSDDFQELPNISR